MVERAWWLMMLDEAQIIVIGISLIVLICFTSVHLIYFFVGAVLSGLTAKMLKRVIRQPRPKTMLRQRKIPSYGMPSSHSLVMAFFSMYCHLSLSLPTSSSVNRSSLLLLLLVKTVLYTATALVVWSRVYLGYHSLSQVSVGCLVGVTMAYGWHLLWQKAVVKGHVLLPE
ncbi:PAP2 superfamily-domain-containing protein [Dichotomocladium elegans]|nr:PAP2 superfamily-domain-containing protein [Dichotomocladium elegans]